MNGQLPKDFNASGATVRSARETDHAVIRELFQQSLLDGQLREGDALALDHRPTAALLVRGIDPVLILRELLGYPDGLCGGMGGHMHLFSKEHLTASSGIVGSEGPAAAGVAALRFVPDSLRLPVGSDPASVRVVEVLADGSEGRDVTAEPGLELTQPPDVAKVELTAAGPVVRPVGTGETRIGARLGLLTAEAPLKVTVSGDRFVSVETTPNWGENDFTVTIEVLAAASEGPLEYRVHGEGSPAPEAWIASQEFGEHRRVVLQSPRLPYRGEGALYNLVIESRDPAGGVAQRYPFTFRLVRNIQRTDKP